MIRIKYTKTRFNPPVRISEYIYNSIRLQLKQDPNYEIELGLNSEKFSQHFKLQLNIIGTCLILVLLAFGIFRDNDIGIIVAGFSILACLWALIYLILEGPSYAVYLKKKKEYFQRMKYIIQDTSSYSEFQYAFYFLDYYKVLNVETTSSKEEIKNAYYQSVSFYKENKNPSVLDKYIQVSEAYHILANDEKRLVYDRLYNAFFLEHIDITNCKDTRKDYENYSDWVADIRIKRNKSSTISCDSKLTDIFYFLAKNGSLILVIMGGVLVLVSLISFVTLLIMI